MNDNLKKYLTNFPNEEGILVNMVEYICLKELVNLWYKDFAKQYKEVCNSQSYFEWVEKIRKEFQR